MPHVADTPAVNPMPTTAAGPGYRMPEFRTQDYIPEILRGQRAVSAGMRAQEEKERADAKINLQAAIDKYWMDGRAALVQKGGLLDMHGQQVLGKVNGKDYTQRGYETLHGIAEGIAVDMGLSGEVRDEYYRRLLQVDKTFYPELQAHYAREDYAYRQSVQKDRIAVQVSHVADGRDIDEAYAEAKRARFALRSMSGLSTNADLIEAEAKADISKGATQYVANCILNNVPETAQLWLMSRRQNVAGSVNADTLVGLQNAVKTAMTQKQQNIQSNELAQRLVNQDSPTGRVTSILENAGGSKALLDQMTKEAADSVGAQGWEDNPESVRRYKQQGIEKLIGDVGGVGAAFAVMGIASTTGLTLDESKARFSEAMAAAMKEGDPNAFINHLTPREKQAYTRFRTRYLTEKNKPRTLEDYLAEANRLAPLSSPEDRMAVALLAKTKGDALQAERDGLSLGYLNEAQRMFESGNYDLSNMISFTGASEDTKQAILALRKSYITGTYETGGDMELFTSLLQNPQGLKSLSPLDFEKLRSRLGRQNYEILSARRRELESAGVPPGDLDQGKLLDAVQMWAKKHNWDITDKKVKASVSALVDGLQEPMLVLLKERGTKGGFTAEEYNTTVESYLNSHASDPSGFTTTDVTLGELDADSISGGIKDALAKRFHLDPSVLEGDTLKMYYVNAITNPMFSLGDVIPLQDQARIRDEYMAAQGGMRPRPPNDAMVTRIWLREQMNDTPALRALGLRTGGDGRVGTGIQPQSFNDSQFDPNDADYRGVD